MPSAHVEFPQLKITGTADCVGGKHPDPPLDAYPLLCWAVSHPIHGSKVFTEDGSASVEAIAMAAAESSNTEAIAAKYGTTPAHVEQAIAYAIAAMYLGSE